MPRGLQHHAMHCDAFVVELTFFRRQGDDVNVVTEIGEFRGDAIEIVGQTAVEVTLSYEFGCSECDAQFLVPVCPGMTRAPVSRLVSVTACYTTVGAHEHREHCAGREQFQISIARGLTHAFAQRRIQRQSLHGIRECGAVSGWDENAGIGREQIG